MKTLTSKIPVIAHSEKKHSKKRSIGMQISRTLTDNFETAVIIKLRKLRKI